MILLDVQMPKMNGYEFLRVLRTLPLLNQIPVAVTTDSNRYDEEERCLALGAVEVLTRPYNPNVVRARVANIIHLR